MNTITFSTDMSTLYLIDSGRSIPFDLEKNNGVLVAVLRGQLTVVSAPVLTPSDGGSVIDPTQRAVVPDPEPLDFPPYPEELTVPLRDNRFTVFYQPGQKTIGIIGATDIDLFIKQKKKPNTVISLFPLDDRIIHIRKRNNRLQISRVPF